MWESSILIGQRVRYGRGVRGSLEEHKHSGLAQGQEKRGESDILSFRALNKNFTWWIWSYTSNWPRQSANMSVHSLNRAYKVYFTHALWKSAVFWYWNRKVETWDRSWPGKVVWTAKRLSFGGVDSIMSGMRRRGVEEEESFYSVLSCSSPTSSPECCAANPVPARMSGEWLGLGRSKPCWRSKRWSKPSMCWNCLERYKTSSVNTPDHVVSYAELQVVVAAAAADDDDDDDDAVVAWYFHLRK